MSILQSQSVQYTFNPQQITKLIAADLGKREDQIKVQFVVENTADDRWGGNNYEVTKIEVTVQE